MANEEFEVTASLLHGKTSQWSATAMTPMFFGFFDARVLVPLFLVIMRPGYTTLIIAATLIVGLVIAQWFRMSPVVLANGLWVWVSTFGFTRGLLVCKDRKGGYDG